MNKQDERDMMKHRIKIIYLFLMVVSICLLGSNIIVIASEDGFSVSVTKPSSQVDDKADYLDLRIKPSKKEKLEVTVSNNSKDSPIDIGISYHSATTNKNGIIEYGASESKISDSLSYAFEDIVTGPKQTTLKPGETKILTFDIKMPDDSFDGYIAGGIELAEKVADPSKPSVVTEFSYKIGMRLSQNGNKVDSELIFKKVQASFVNYEPALLITMDNVQAKYIEALEINVDIVPIGKENVLVSSSSDGLRIAPNSLYEYPVFLKEPMLKTGKYEAIIKLKTGDGYTRDWREPFYFDQNSVLVKNDPEESKQSNRFIIIFSSVIILLVTIILIAYFVILKQKNKKTPSQRRR